jgi:hypothetical protein
LTNEQLLWLRLRIAMEGGTRHALGAQAAKGLLTKLLRIVEAVLAWFSNRASVYSSQLQIAEVHPCLGDWRALFMTGVD